MVGRHAAPPRSHAAGSGLFVVRCGIPARAAADEALARAGTKLYRDTLTTLREAGMAFLQPGRHLMPLPGPSPPGWSSSRCAARGAFAGLLAKRYDAYVDAVRRDMASPLFAEVDRLVVLADVLSALHAGEAAFADTSAALSAAAGSLRWEFSWLQAFAALAALKLPPRIITRSPSPPPRPTTSPTASAATWRH